MGKRKIKRPSLKEQKRSKRGIKAFPPTQPKKNGGAQLNEGAPNFFVKKSTHQQKDDVTLVNQCFAFYIAMINISHKWERLEFQQVFFFFFKNKWIPLGISFHYPILIKVPWTLTPEKVIMKFMRLCFVGKWNSLLDPPNWIKNWLYFYFPH